MGERGLGTFPDGSRKAGNRGGSENGERIWIFQKFGRGSDIPEMRKSGTGIAPLLSQDFWDFTGKLKGKKNGEREFWA